MIYMKNELSQKIERNKLKALLFFQENKKVFIKTIQDQYYFGNIIKITDSVLNIRCFAPSEKAFKSYGIYFIDITLIEEYVPKEEMKQ